MNDVVCEASVVCQSEVSRVWRAVTDTDALNEAAGMRRLEVQPFAGPSAARFVVSTWLGLFNVTYEEEPYAWSFERSFGVRRHLRNGPARTLTIEFELTATASSGTQVDLILTLVPRVSVLRPFIYLSGRRALQNLCDAIAQVDALPPQVQTLLRAKALPQVHEKRLRAALERLRPSVSPEALTHLGLTLRTGSDVQVMLMRPFQLADAWQMPRAEVLRAMLRAAEIELLVPSWQAICPSCRLPSQTFVRLDQLGQHATCQLCDIKYTVRLEDAVELTFAPSPTLRSLDVRPFCIGGPARMPHVLAQAVVPARGEAPLHAPHLPGQYRLFVRGGAQAPVLLTDDGAAEVPVDLLELKAQEPLRAALGGTFILKNLLPVSLHAKLETVTWASQSVSAAEVLAMPEFSDRFAPPPWLWKA